MKIEQRWTRGSSASVHDVQDLTGGSDFGAFSAVAWYFGRQLADALRSLEGAAVPIGLVSSNIGGTAIQDWSPAAANAGCNGGNPPPYPPWLPFPPKAGVPPQPCPRCMGNATLYNGNVAPFTVGPMRLSGMLWYQGEANADVNQTYGYYDCALKGLIRSWRRGFGNAGAFFGVVMLAAYTTDASFSPAGIAPLRDTQMACLDLVGVALVAATDLGDPGTAIGPGGASSLHSVHPRHKRPLGARLAAAALDLRYGVGGAARDYVSPR